MAADRESDPFALTRAVADRADALTFDHKVAWSYNPLQYAWKVHEAYLERFGTGRKKAVFLGMNPGPWGMAQTGIPFSDTTIAGDWMGLRGIPIGSPENEDPDRPVLGWDLERTEGSGQRLYGYVRDRYGDLATFFADHITVNYLPLVMFDEDGKNLPPSRLLKEDRKKVFRACDPYLEGLVAYYEPEVLVGIGKFALRRLEACFENHDARIVDIPHPSPASPIATREGGAYWKRLVDETLEEAGLLP